MAGLGVLPPNLVGVASVEALLRDASGSRIASI